jgi:hypothetical protein
VRPLATKGADAPEEFVENVFIQQVFAQLWAGVVVDEAHYIKNESARWRRPRGVSGPRWNMLGPTATVEPGRSVGLLDETLDLLARARRGLGAVDGPRERVVRIASKPGEFNEVTALDGVAPLQLHRLPVPRQLLARAESSGPGRRGHAGVNLRNAHRQGIDPHV